MKMTLRHLVCFENTFCRRSFCVVGQWQQRSLSRNLSYLASPRACPTLLYVHRPGRSVLASHYQQHIQREDSRHLKFSDWLRMKDDGGRSRPLAWAAHVGQWAHQSEVASTHRAGDLISDVGASVRSLADAIGLEPDREPRLPKAWQSLTARRLGRLLLVSPESTDLQLGYHRRAPRSQTGPVWLPRLMSIFTPPKSAMRRSGGEGIRTPDRDSPMPVFKTGAFNRSATPPVGVSSYRLPRLNEWLLLQQANHRGNGFLHQPAVFVVK